MELQVQTYRRFPRLLSCSHISYESTGKKERQNLYNIKYCCIWYNRSFSQRAKDTRSGEWDYKAHSKKNDRCSVLPRGSKRSLETIPSYRRNVDGSNPAGRCAGWSSQFRNQKHHAALQTTNTESSILPPERTESYLFAVSYPAAPFCCDEKSVQFDSLKI